MTKKGSKKDAEGSFVPYQSPSKNGPWNPMVQSFRNSKLALEYACEHGTPDALCQVHQITTPVFRIEVQHLRKLVEVKGEPETS